MLNFHNANKLSLVRTKKWKQTLLNNWGNYTFNVRGDTLKYIIIMFPDVCKAQNTGQLDKKTQLNDWNEGLYVKQNY